MMKWLLLILLFLFLVRGIAAREAAAGRYALVEGWRMCRDAIRVAAKAWAVPIALVFAVLMLVWAVAASLAVIGDAVERVAEWLFDRLYRIGERIYNAIERRKADE